LLEHRLDRDDLAIGSLSRAYRASNAAAMAEPHILSASALSVVMRSMGDYEQALALNQEKVDWDAARGANLSLSVSRFMRGRILQLMGNYSAAIEQFVQSRRLSGTLHDRQGVAFSDLRTCEAHIDLGEFSAAQAECGSAARIFAASTDLESVKETQALQARIELGLGRPARARALLDKVLDRNGADLPPRDVAPMFDARARANAELQSYEEAYRDLREYTNRYVAATEADRRRQAGTLRARFETDREIDRNASLKRELASSLDRAERQERQLRQNEIVAGTGGLVIALLAYFLVMSVRYRRRMVKLANMDGLTGLPNRRRVSQFAEAALQFARATGEPLAIAIMDMDHFKEINDCCGHATGDHVLKEFARIGAEALRPCDMLGRWGGEEFLLIMPGASLSVAKANLERLRTLMCGIRLPPVSGAGLPVTLSAGVAQYCANVRSLDDMIARADRALYAAKSAGRDCVRVADMSQITGSHAVRRAQRQ
jgi:diguanylate cyclase (GGDEF)-like protein